MLICSPGKPAAKLTTTGTHRLSVSLIGSFRKHYQEVEKAARVFIDAGLAINSPPISRIIDRNREFVRFDSDSPLTSDCDIQAATLAKILASDFVYVVNPRGYIGRMTAYELGRIHERKMAVYYAEFPRDLPVEVPPAAVFSAHELAAIAAAISRRTSSAGGGTAARESRWRRGPRVPLR